MRGNPRPSCRGGIAWQVLPAPVLASPSSPRWFIKLSLRAYNFLYEENGFSQIAPCGRTGYDSARAICSTLRSLQGNGAIFPGASLPEPCRTAPSGLFRHSGAVFGAGQTDVLSAIHRIASACKAFRTNDIGRDNPVPAISFHRARLQRSSRCHTAAYRSRKGCCNPACIRILRSPC